MISMSKVHSIRQMRMAGESIAQISRTLEVSRDTVYKYLAAEDLSPEPPKRKAPASILDEHRDVIIGWLEEDSKNWRKQRHTARRIWQRFRDEHGATAAESTVRHYVCRLKRELKIQDEAYLDLVWAPGIAQADFGEDDFYVRGTKKRMSYFVLTFPFSNVGLAQVFPGENAECVCQALKDIFEYIGGVPTRIVFDNATGVGRRIGEKIRTAKLFGAFATHHGFAFSFCNPDSGHEKGNVENKVGTIRRNLFVPTPAFDSGIRYSKTLLDRSLALSDKPHWIKGEAEDSLFIEDRFALLGLPEHPFDVVRHEYRRADKLGRIRMGSKHLYSTSPEFAGEEGVVAIRARTITVSDGGGTTIAYHERAYGDAPTDTTDPASQLALLARKPGGWRESRVRSALDEDLRDYMDGLGKEELKAELRLMRDVASNSGWQRMASAAGMAYAATGRLDEASLKMAAASLGSAPIGYDEPVDLSVYDRAIAERAE